MDSRLFSTSYLHSTFGLLWFCILHLVTYQPVSQDKQIVLQQKR